MFGTKLYKKKIFVGLSGGVDSAVSAALLQKEGHDVTGVFIRIALEGYPCTAGEDKISAQKVAARLRIPFLEIDLSQEYKKRVFEISIQEFEKGRTPNPDALCNREIKFGIFFDWCMQQGAHMVATGHYAQLAKLAQKKVLGPPVSAKPQEAGRPDYFSEQVSLLAGADPEKDQSYFLALVPEEKLRKTLFPIGHLHKPEVRKLAKKFGLPNAERKDSQGLCFLGPVSIDEMLHKEIKLTPGNVLNEAGEIVGKHKGAAAYTLGERRGFELFVHTPNSEAQYVIAKNIANNTITVSPNKLPIQKETKVVLEETNWIGNAPNGPCMARYRYRQKLIPAEKVGSVVLLHEPHYVPAGQALVLYRGEQCLGGGIIS